MVGGLITVALNALADSERKPPTEFKIFPYGTVDTTKGTFKFTPEACDALLEERARHSADVQIDYDHLAIESAKPGDGKAAGWCTLEKRDDGLWAVNVRWTPAAAQMLSDGEYRYFSPFFGATKREKLIVMLMNIAITNLPATYNIEALVAASRLGAYAMGGAAGGVAESLTEFRVQGVQGDIRKGSDGKFRLYSSDGKQLLGTHDTEEQAKAHESAVNISKAREAGHNIPKKAKETHHMAHKLGGYLAKHLKEKGMAMKALAEKVGMPEERVRDLHDGADPTPEEMSALAKHFGLKGPEELEEQVDSFNGDNTDGEDEDTPAEKRVEAGGGAGVNPSAASRRRQRQRVDDDADASALLIGLTGEENLNSAAEKIAGVIEVAATVPQMRKELDALRKKNEQADRERIIRKGKDQGKLTPALIRILASESVAKAERMLEAFPVLNREQRDLRETEPSAAAVVLSAEELELCRLTREPVAKMAKFINENGQKRDELYGDNSDAILMSYRTE